MSHDPRFSHVVAFDDFPFTHGKRGDVPIVGVVYSGQRLEGVLSGTVRQDGVNSTRTILRLLTESKFAGRAQLVLLQGVALGGFNVIDAHTLHQKLGLPVLVVARRQPNFPAIEDALKTKVPGGARKWALIQRLGPMEAAAGVYVQRVGLTLSEAEAVITRYAIHGTIPEPLRTAHLIAGGMATGQSRGRT
jgi:endonuclease V-like protein UPF0215 family